MKKVSIVMPVYNGEEYISESIESIINQSYSNWELIIVNEYGSNEETVDIIQSFLNTDKRIKLIQNEKKEGISESLNIGLRASSGEYIARMDSDDISGKDRLKKQVEYLDNNLEIGLCGIVPEFIGSEEIYWELETDPVQIKSNIFFYTPCVHPSIMFRREIIDKYNIYYNKDYKATEDYDFFSRVVGVTNVANINDKSLFKYRMYPNNATNRNNNIGIKIYSEIMKNCFTNYLNLNFSEEEINLLDCHISTRNISNQDLYSAITKLDLLLKKVLYSASIHGYDVNKMFKTLKKRWQELRWSIPNSRKNSAINFFIDKSIFNRDSICVNNNIDLEKADITVLMPVYNSENYIIDSILTLQDQTYKNFLIYILVEYDSDDNTEKYLSIFHDNRIKVIRNKEKLGLAKTLNEGIKMSKTKFIARMDSDDLSMPDRLEKERKYLLENPDITLVSTWQRHFGDFGTYIHKSACSSDDLAAALLFRCDVCHSTIMFKRDNMIKNNYFYNPDMAMEDFDLWNRMLKTEKIACIPEVLGEYRIHENNITQAKHQKVIDSEISIISRNLENLGIMRETYDERLLIGWDFLYNEIPELKKEAEILFENILEKNKIVNLYNQESLKLSLMKRMDWINGKGSYNVLEEYKIGPAQSKIKKIIKKLIKPIINPFYSRLMYRINNKIDERTNYLNNELNSLKTNYSELKETIKNISKEQALLTGSQSIYNSYNGGKINIAIIFQIASFWPSLESVYKTLIEDARFNVKLFLIEQEYKEPSQMMGAKEFLKNNKIEYETLTIDKLQEFYPHVAIIQTPYDEWHREQEFSSTELKKMGIRLIYIPYGIEFSGTEESLKLEFCSQFINNMWRIYTISEVTQKYYCIYSKHTINDVKALGHPKFDGLVNKTFTTNYDFRKLSKNKKIVLIKIHFPKYFNGKQVTPELSIYIELLNKADKYENIYFVVMLHPLMYDNMKNKESLKLLKKLQNTDNIFVFKDEDYREPVLAADAFICDRSSLAIEFAALDKPILFLESRMNTERYIPEFNELLDSYQKGYDLCDIEKFLGDIEQSKDISRNNRNKEFEKCVTLHDGYSGNRIVNDIYEGISYESKEQ